jgi:hypothetical protein
MAYGRSKPLNGEAAYVRADRAGASDRQKENIVAEAMPPVVQAQIADEEAVRVFAEERAI